MELNFLDNNWSRALRRKLEQVSIILAADGKQTFLEMVKKKKNGIEFLAV